MADISPEQKAVEIFNLYNPNGLVPFPFDEITKAEPDLEIKYLSDLDENLSGAILYLSENQKFVILVNSNKPKTRQYFTLAHELGHFYLHKKLIKDGKGLVDKENTLDSSTILFRNDIAKNDQIERHANRFAAVLIMPEELVKDAWNELKDVGKCADVFGVSVLAMSIRLEKLGIPT